jgi:hypothetical protein
MSDPWVRPTNDPWARRTTHAPSAPPPARPPAGWYPDPTGRQRYWDGRAWGPPQPSERRRPIAWIVVGWLGVLLIPIVGIVCGIVLLIKEELAHGLAQILLSVAVVWLYVAGVIPGY